MNLAPSDFLSKRQQLQLAWSVVVVYLPIRVYINIHDLSQVPILQRLPLWMMEVTVNVLFFFLWINVIEWVQQRFFSWFGRGFLMEFKIPAQLAMFSMATVLAIMFNIGFRGLWSFAEDSLEQRFGLAPNHSPENSVAHHFTKQQKKKANMGLTILAMLSAFYLASNRRAYQQLENIQLKAERLEKENVKAQFNALKNQVSPHFLFNNFSILSSLVEIDSELAGKFLQQLSKAYRYILEQSDNERVSLKVELEFIETYLFLLKMRFDEKLNVKIDIPESVANRYSIAPLTLQLLVENAVKHNRMSAEEPLLVSIHCDETYLSVVNPIQPRPQSEPSTGLGLNNIVNRYKLLTSSPVLITQKDGVFRATIPLLT
ncbi:sensor histidine kinase [Runella limosa]|uniref:sensor histidine kinase n=1 Tax=Runella limosa TaxID=370978 RepID=UPI000402AD24|nr:histidine kinase [Runella limosa]